MLGDAAWCCATADSCAHALGNPPDCLVGWVSFLMATRVALKPVVGFCVSSLICDTSRRRMNLFHGRNHHCPSTWSVWIPVSCGWDYIPVMSTLPTVQSQWRVQLQLRWQPVLLLSFSRSRFLSSSRPRFLASSLSSFPLCSHLGSTPWPFRGLALSQMGILILGMHWRGVGSHAGKISALGSKLLKCGLVEEVGYVRGPQFVARFTLEPSATSRRWRQRSSYCTPSFRLSLLSYN